MDLTNLTHGELLVFAAEVNSRVKKYDLQNDKDLAEEIYEEFKRRNKIEEEKCE